MLATSMFTFGNTVIVTRRPEYDCEYTDPENSNRKRYDGKVGKIINEIGPYSFGYTVMFPDKGAALYEPEELNLFTPKPKVDVGIWLPFSVRSEF